MIRRQLLKGLVAVKLFIFGWKPNAEVSANETPDFPSMAYSDDGLTLYVGRGTTIHEYSFSTPGDRTTAVLVRSFTVDEPTGTEGAG